MNDDDFIKVLMFDTDLANSEYMRPSTLALPMLYAQHVHADYLANHKQLWNGDDEPTENENFDEACSKLIEKIVELSETAKKSRNKGGWLPIFYSSLKTELQYDLQHFHYQPFWDRLKLREDWKPQYIAKLKDCVKEVFDSAAR